MTTKIVEGFDWFPSGLNSTQRSFLWGANGWFAVTGGSNGGPANVTTGRFAFGKAMTLSASTNGFGNVTNHMIIPIDALATQGFIAFGMYYSSGMGTASNCKVAIGFYDGVNAQYQMSVVFRFPGVIEIWRGDPMGGVKLATTPIGCFEEDKWFMVEIEGIVADVAGFCEVRLNTVQKLQVPTGDTRGGTITSTFDSYHLTAHSGLGDGTVTLIIDDLNIFDDAGTTNNDWMGNLRVKTQFMIANGAINDFSIGGTIPAATNWQSVNNFGLDDTKYVYSPNIGDVDLYTPDPNLNAPYVRALQVRMALKQDDATQRTAKAVLRLSGVDYDDDVEHFTNQDYTFYFGLWELNPATGVSFTGAEVNAAQVGVKVES